MTDHHHQATALVTGAASGIGRQIAISLAARGWSIWGVDIDEKGLDHTVRAIASSGGFANGEVADLTDLDQLENGVANVLSAGGVPKLLVNVAGTAVRANVPDTSPDDWSLVLGLNLTAVYRICRVIIPAMAENGGGQIINIASVAGLVGIANRAAYCASKAGLIGLTKAIAVDHAAEGIRANAICPGTIETEWIDRIVQGAEDPDQMRQQMTERQLIGRMGTPNEVAALVAFLASEEATFFTGSHLVVDGGMTAV